MDGDDVMSSHLDELIRAYREDPTPENKQRLLEAQRANSTAFMRNRSVEYIERTIERRSR